ncbi:MAG: HAD-IB family hydrolase [Pseudomonadota bacterium]
MKLYARVTRDVDEGPKGSHIAALFDFDGTLIAGFSVFAFFREQLRRGEISRAEVAKLAMTGAGYGLGNVGFSGLLLASARLLQGMPESHLEEMGREVFNKRIAKVIYPEARALVEAHKRAGHTVAIVSSATRFQVQTAADELEIEHVLCSELETENGHFTGNIVQPTCFGPGKVSAAEMLAQQYDLDLDDSYFYSDSHDDLALLERVGRPRPLNPNNKLVEVAEDRGWPVRRFASRGRPRASDVLRTLGATGSMVPSFLAGLPIWALTGSRTEGQNFSMSMFADVASAFIGLNLAVTGEHHLWENRPAVFVFNHQSQADVVIMARLLRRDIAGVGKKEIASVPVLGQIMQMAGTVMIDRSDAHKAVESMRRLVDTITIEGKSVVIAPEGTRTVTTQLGPFKKGAFHLAMQAGVPIVPIVIKNALDVSPKGDFLFHPATVGVEVLPPVDTSNWRAETIEEHVADVRRLFLQTLGQAT